MGGFEDVTLLGAENIWRTAKWSHSVRTEKIRRAEKQAEKASVKSLPPRTDMSDRGGGNRKRKGCKGRKTHRCNGFHIGQCNRCCVLPYPTHIRGRIVSNKTRGITK